MEDEFLDQSFYQDWNEYDESMENDEFYDVKPRKTKKHEIPLVNDDYNLNSPIMKDIIENLHMLNNGSGELRHHVNRTIRVWKPYSDNNLIFPTVGGMEGSYKMIFNFISDECEVGLTSIDNIAKTVDEEIIIIKEVVDLFVKSLGADPLQFDFFKIISENKTLQNLWFKILEINLISECMVAGKNRFNVKNYDQSFRFQLMKSDLIKFTTTHFNGYLSDEVLYDANNDIFLDKNMILMIKDMLTGRFNTQLLINLNLESKYSEELPKLFNSLLKEGDKLILQEGNSAYESIAVLEAFTVNRIHQLADSSRERIIISDHFDNFINSKISEGSKHSIKFKEFLKQFLSNMTNPYDLTVIYGSFRLWGHPYIEYEAGLNKVKEQVRMPKPKIDENYAKLLANDLMKSVLIRNFKRNRSWSVKDNENNKNIKGTGSLINDLWPKPNEFLELEGHWDELDIDPILEIPEDLEDSSIFADKTHSLDLDEITKYVARDSSNPIPTRRVLKTYLEKPRVNVKEFILNIDKNGLTKNQLLIGLKAKERELKRFGRFFTLMTWDLRLYFVVSEYMIKKDFIKLFPGLTMADGFIDVINKMLDRTEGQRGSDYDKITYANHIDYSKWNNHQRDEAVKPVFEILDKCYGLSNFFARTHSIFKSCIVYYPERPDKWGSDNEMYWEGQPGGFEGIRQKGWSLVGILCLMRESKYRNTKVELLAQGDNQVVFTSYQLNNKLTELELTKELKNIYENNDRIMKRIKVASVKIGLIINEEETLQSAGCTFYSKVPVFKGNILNLESKKVNRMSGITNDQLPTIANIMSSVNSTALTICQYDSNVRNAVYLHLIFGIIVLNVMKLWNPMGQFGERVNVYSKNSLSKWLYHDQCLGGNTGIALTRFLIRRFPDPISECLSFYKYMMNNLSDRHLSESFRLMGNPIGRNSNIYSFAKLLEDPTCLNIKKGSNILVIIKDQVKRSLINYSDNIKNDLLKNSLNKISEQEEYLLEFLHGITPVFPRFLSDFRQASICGYIDSVIGLVQNSKTMRSMFSNEFEMTVRDKVTRWEKEQWVEMKNNWTTREIINWSCSSEHADYLRKVTWGFPILGATIPHPYEYQSNIVFKVQNYVNSGKRDLITCIIPKRISHSLYDHGGNRPYLGSNTKESSSAIQPWEKELTNPIFRKASDLRRGINWIMNNDSKLALSIYSNLQYVTNINLIDEYKAAFKRRTGTAHHRYKTSRQDNGGFCNITPNILSWFVVTSDYMTDLSDTNYDFMYQASLIYTETIGAHILLNPYNLSSFGLSISCEKCIREVTEINLESSIVYKPQSISAKFWIGKLHKTDVIIEDPLLEQFFPGTTEVMRNTSFSVGIHQGIASTIKLDRINDNLMLSDLFTMGVMMKMDGENWFKGLLIGLVISAGYSVLNSASFLNNKYHNQIIKNRAYSLIKRLSEDGYFFPVLRLNNLSDWLMRESNFISPSYPPTSSSISRAFSSYSYEKMKDLLNNRNDWINLMNREFIIYKDFDNDDFKLVLLIGLQVLKNVNSDIHNTNKLRSLKNLFEIYNLYKINRGDEDYQKLLVQELLDNDNFMRISDSELKIPVEKIKKLVQIFPDIGVYRDLPGYKLNVMDLKRFNIMNSEKLSNIECPIISGIRAYRCATGAHYKLNDILNWLDIDPKLAIIGGDGSGGISSLVLRKYDNLSIIFNSLLEFKDINLRGGQPGQPQAIMKLDKVKREKCMNLQSCWMEPSDLTTTECWGCFEDHFTYFGKLKKRIDLIILDMEARSLDSYIKIYQNMIRFVKRGYFNTEVGITVTKCYTGMIKELSSLLINAFPNSEMFAVNGRFTSTFSTEIYIVQLHSSRPKNLNLVKCVYEVDDLNYSIKDELNEFKRALSIDIKQLYNAIPRSLQENYESYMVEYCTSLQIPPSLSLLIVTAIVNNYYSLGLNHFIYHTCITYGNEQDVITSDNKLNKVICFVISVLYYKSLLKKEFLVFEIGNILNNKKLKVYNNKINKLFLIKWGNEDIRDFNKDIGPIRDNSLVNLILRSLLGAKYTIDYNELEILDSLHKFKYKNNIDDLLEGKLN